MDSFAIISNGNKQKYLYDYLIFHNYSAKLVTNFNLAEYKYIVASIPFSKDGENVNCDLISIKYDLLSIELVQKLHKNNKEVHVWTINNIDKISHAIDLNVDNIITNDVILAKGILNYKSNK